MQNREDILRPFAETIFIKSQALKNDSLQLTKIQQRRFCESINDDLKKCSNFIVPEVSESAKKEADKLEIDLSVKSWHDQSAFDLNRQVFHFEHMTPVTQIRESCLSCDSSEKILGKLKSMRVAWILKSEDSKLTKLGYRSKRPDPDEAYRKASIILIKRKSPNQFLKPRT